MSSLKEANLSSIGDVFDAEVFDPVINDYVFLTSKLETHGVYADYGNTYEVEQDPEFSEVMILDDNGNEHSGVEEEVKAKALEIMKAVYWEREV